MNSKGLFSFFLTLFCAALILVGCSNLLSKLNSVPPQSAEQDFSSTNTNQELIGGQQDDHGCLIAAGYRWCQEKEKCLRIWEETCYEADQLVLEKLIAQKVNKSTDSIRVIINEDNGTHAVGSIRLFEETESAGGSFMAVKIADQWQIVYSGNGSIDCSQIKQYNFPQSMLSGFCD
jgi:hypothetical protein